ncbi:MAG: hypothetical protein KDA37_14285 [Planctomycetales bacterium]|nr:hypothetical protein [Planctomycetales bacterium]
MKTSLASHLFHWLRAAADKLSRSPLLLAIALVVGLAVAGWLIVVLAKGVWLILLLAFTVLLLVPDALWVWREHPEVVRRVGRFLRNPRTIRVLLYLLLAYAWLVVLS